VQKSRPAWLPAALGGALLPFASALHHERAKRSHGAALVASVTEGLSLGSGWSSTNVSTVMSGLMCVALMNASTFSPVSASTVIFGEVGLGGEIRPAIFPEIRLKEAANLGFKRGIIPSQSVGQELQSAIETVPVRDLKQTQEAVFG